MDKKPTIKDIAKFTKASPTAVSLVLNNRPRISPEMRERILRIAKGLRCRPPIAARSSVNNGSQYVIPSSYLPEL